jgi:tetratricopeptide (TPR) repeat protein
LSLVVVLLATALPAQAASVSLREGLYAEEVEGDLDRAIDIYQQIVDDKASARNIVAQALYRQGMCYVKQKKESEAKAAFSRLIADHSDQAALIEKVRPLLEELGNADPAALMPPETVAYIEIGTPGKQVETILKMLEGTPFEDPLAMIGGNHSGNSMGPQQIINALLNPGMMAEFKKIRGMGLGLTGMAQNNPPFVLVMFPGKSDALRGILQMVLGMAGRPAEAIEGMSCVTISDTVAAAYDENAVILAQGPKSLQQLQWSARQYKGLAHDPTLASSNRSFATVGKKARQDNALTVWVNADEVYSGLVKTFPANEVPMQIQMANGFVDFAGIDDLITSLSLQQTGIALEANVNFKEGHHSMAYGMARTPNLSKAALRAVPADAIAVVSVALGGADTPLAQMAGQQIKNGLGLDIGPDLFNNIEQISLFALPFRRPTEQLNDDMPPQIKSMGIAITSANPQKTYDLLGTLMRKTDLAVSETAPAGGRYSFTLPNQQSVYGFMDESAKVTVLSLDSDIVEMAMTAIRQSSATTKTGPLSEALKTLPDTTNKLVMVNAAGLIEFVAQSAHMPNDEMTDQIRSAITQLAQAGRKTTLELRTSEQANSLSVRLAVNDLPPLGEALGPITQITQMMEHVHQPSGSWAASTTPPATVLSADTAPTIDGKVDACWDKTQAYAIENSFYSPASSPEDCSATFKTLWDENGLYVLVDVTDDDLQNDSDDFWQDDTIEIFIDADNSKSDSYDDTDYQYHFGWDATSPTMGESQHGKTDGVKYAFARTEKGYRLEVQFSWSTLGGKAAPGVNIGLDVQVNDDDGGGDRDSKLAWRATQDDAWQNPRAFGTAQLAGLIAWWKLDESSGDQAHDASGNNRTGKLVGGPTWQPTGGRVGGALALDGQNDYVDTGYKTDSPMWTIAAWVKSPSAPSDAKQTGPIHREKNFQINWDHMMEEFRGAAALCIGGTWYDAGFGELKADTWYHLAATYDGENLKTYKNGILVTDNSSPSGAPDAEEQTLKLGRHALDNSYFNGAIDEVRIYNYALGQADVAALAGGQ